MRLGLHWLVAVSCLLVARRSFVSTAPSHPYSEKGHWMESRMSDMKDKSDEMDNGSSLAQDSSQAADEDVKELELLKPKTKTLSVVKTHSTIFSNINGEKEQHSKTKEEVEKNGQLVARVSQEVDKADDVPPHIKTALDIPSKNIHKVLEEPGKEESETKRIPFSKHLSMAENNNVDAYKMTGLHYSPLDMAEYVFWTGDEKGVTMAIEEFLQNGLMTREEAIGFLQEIKQNLDYLQAHYSEDRYHGMKDKLEERGGSDLSEVRQQIQDNLSKKSELQESAQNDGSLTEDDYEDLLERLRAADLLYNEYSLEEVVYQLAKLMFTQSLTRGSTEAQEALQKFTNFLELEAQQGRISRNLEKKVLDVLIASLSDTLTEHPGLMNTARETLLSGVPNDQFLQNFMNQGKSGLNRGQNGMRGMEMKQHRFQANSATNMKKTLQNSGLQDTEKKST